MKKMVITIGIPASGKTTWAKELLKKEPGWKRINRDDLRLMLDGKPYIKGDLEREKFITKLSDLLIENALAAGYNVVIDNTSLPSNSRKSFHEIAKKIGDVEVIEKVFPVTLDEAIRRNELRTGYARLHPDVITMFAKRFPMDDITGKFKNIHDSTIFYPKRVSNGLLLQDTNLPKAIVCDLDGTLALIHNRNPYDASNCDIVDIPNVPVIECVKAMYNRGNRVIFVSGREDKFREQTERFIKNNVRVEHPNAFEETALISYELYMRKSGDLRKDSLVKREIYEQHIKDRYFINFILDDRNQVVDEWRSLGFTVFQVAEGNF